MKYPSRAIIFSPILMRYVHCELNIKWKLYNNFHIPIIEEYIGSFYFSEYGIKKINNIEFLKDNLLPGITRIEIDFFFEEIIFNIHAQIFNSIEFNERHLAFELL